MTSTSAPALTTTVPQLRAWFAARIEAQTPSASITWVMPLRRVTFPTGLRGIVGQAEVTAPGFRTSRMMVTADGYGRSAR